MRRASLLDQSCAIVWCIWERSRLSKALGYLYRAPGLAFGEVTVRPRRNVQLCLQRMVRTITNCNLGSSDICAAVLQMVLQGAASLYLSLATAATTAAAAPLLRRSAGCRRLRLPSLTNAVTRH